MKLYAIVNKYDDGYETFSKAGNGDTFTSRKLADQARQYLLDSELGKDEDYFGDYQCFVHEHETYSDFEAWKKQLID